MKNEPPMRKGWIGLMLLVALGTASHAQPPPVPTCDVTQDLIDARVFRLTGPTCPVIGRIVVYTHAGVDGAGAPIPNLDNLALSLGPFSAGIQAGIWLPRTEDP